VDLSDSSSCSKIYVLTAFGALSESTSYHMEISFNATNLSVVIDDDTYFWSRSPTDEQYIGTVVPVWWMSDKYGSSLYNLGNGTFSNIIIRSVVLPPPTPEPTAAPTLPTMAPTTSAKPTAPPMINIVATPSPTRFPEPTPSPTASDSGDGFEEADAFNPDWMQYLAMIFGGVLFCLCNLCLFIWVFRQRERSQNAPGQNLANVINHRTSSRRELSSYSPYSTEHDRSIRGSVNRSHRSGSHRSRRSERDRAPSNRSDRTNITYSNVGGGTFSKQSSLAPRPQSFHGNISSPGSSVAMSDRGDFKAGMVDEEEGHLSDPGVPEEMVAGHAMSPVMRSAPRRMMPPPRSSNRMPMMKPYEQWLVPDIVYWMTTLWDDDRFVRFRDRVQRNLDRDRIVGRDLPGLNHEDLVRFGIDDHGMCIRILEGIDVLVSLPTPGSSLRSGRSVDRAHGQLRPFPNYIPQREPGSIPGSEAASGDDEYVEEDNEYLEEEDENEEYLDEENEKLYGPVGDPNNVFYEETPLGAMSSNTTYETVSAGQSYQL